MKRRAPLMNWKAPVMNCQRAPPMKRRAPQRYQRAPLMKRRASARNRLKAGLIPFSKNASKEEFPSQKKSRKKEKTRQKKRRKKRRPKKKEKRRKNQVSFTGNANKEIYCQGRWYLEIGFVSRGREREVVWRGRVSELRQGQRKEF